MYAAVVSVFVINAVIAALIASVAPRDAAPFAVNVFRLLAVINVIAFALTVASH